MAVQFCPNSWLIVMIASEVTLMVLANAQAKALSCLWLWVVYGYGQSLQVHLLVKQLLCMTRNKP